MTIIGGMVLTAFFLPVVFVGREEGVGLGGGVVDLCETEAVGNGQGLTIDRSSADDIDVFVGGAVLQGFFQRGIDITARDSSGAAGENDVTTVGQGSLGQGEESVPAHDDGMASGEGLETLQVVREPVNQLVLKADGAISRDCCYDRNHTFIFLRQL